jgi:thiol-disulfide isomerase/thioredoxin
LVRAFHEGRPAGVRNAARAGTVVWWPGGGKTRLAMGEDPWGDQPWLAAFFATWCHACQLDLRDLAAYQALRRASSSLPPVLAVDLTVSEPSIAWVWAFVHRLHLPFPVALDAQGSLTQRDGVTALPTLVLVSPHGQVLWRHQGALAAPALARALREALEKADREEEPSSGEGG